MSPGKFKEAIRDELKAISPEKMREMMGALAKEKNKRMDDSRDLRENMKTMMPMQRGEGMKRVIAALEEQADKSERMGQMKRAEQLRMQSKRLADLERANKEKER